MSIKHALLVFSTILLSACASVQEKTDTQSSQLYRNSTVGFEITVPMGWFMPDESNLDPHFYITKECSQERSYCSAFEVQNTDYDIDKTLDQTILQLESYESYDLNPEIVPDLISGAIVIKSKAEGAAHGWGYQYDVIFASERHRFVIFTKSDDLEKTILSTFKLADETQEDS